MLTLVIVTRNRPAYVARALSYYRQQRFTHPILVADSSDPLPQAQLAAVVRALSPSLHLEHRLYPPDSRMEAKLVDALQHVRTRYVVISGDDDFLVPGAVDEAVHFLHQHPDYAVVHGHALAFTLSTPNAYGTIAWIGLFPQNSVELADSAARFQRHLANYCATFDSVERTASALEHWQLELELTDANFGELLPSCLSLIQGKSKKLERLFLIKQGGMPKDFHVPDSLDWLAAPEWPEQYRKFQDRLAHALREKTGLGLDEARHKVKQAFWAYMGHRRLMQEISWDLIDNLNPPQWTPSHWRENDPAFSLPALLSPNHPYHADFVPAFQVMTSVDPAHSAVQPAPAAAPSRRAVATLELLLSSPNLPAALQEHTARLDADVLALVRLNAETARADGQVVLGGLLDDLADHIRSLIDQRQPRAAPPAAAPLSAAQTLQQLLDADDLPAALEQLQPHFTDELLALIKANAQAARQDGDTDLVEGLAALAEYVAVGRR